MGKYLVQVSYTPEAWGAMLKSPQNRVEAVRPAIEKLGGRIEGGWLSFGEYDIIIVAQMPDNASAAGFAIAVSAGGAVKAVKTTPLMSAEEGQEAMRKATGSGYRPPTG